MIRVKEREEVNERITRLRERYQTLTPRISIQRAKYFTEKWKELGDEDVALEKRVALSMQHVYQNMNVHVDPDDRIAGNWTEYFLGLPIDIERGLFNGVLETELDMASMALFQARSYKKFAGYMLKKHGFFGLVRQIKKSASMGPAAVSMGLKPLPKRKINSFDIGAIDKQILQRELLPYWKGRNMADRVADAFEKAGFHSGDMGEFAQAIPSTPAKQAIIVSIGAALATYQGHLILDHELVLRRGLLGMKRDVERKLQSANGQQQEERKFYESQEIALEGLIDYTKNLAEAIKQKWEKEEDPKQREVYAQMLATCRRVPLYPAETLREAVQAFWTIKIAVDLANITNVHAPGRLDQVFFPYYKKDVEEGAITRSEARELMEELLLKVMTTNLRPESNLLGNFYLRYEGSTPVTVGGLTPDGEDAANEMTSIIMEAAGRSRTVTSIVLRVHENTSDELYGKAAEILHAGSSNLSMMNDEVFVESMKRRGFSLEDARDYAITGCTDALCPGKTGGIPFAGLLLSRVLDLTLRNGDAMTLIGLIPSVGLKTGDPGEFEDFDELLGAFYKQIDNMIKVNVDASHLRDKVFAEHMPAPFISLFIDGCLENGRDVTKGGALYDLSGINMINSVANVVDSLHVIRKLVFEEKRITIDHLMEATDDNFVGHKDLYRLVQGVKGKWGNGDPETDKLANDVMNAVFAQAEKYKGYRGGPFVPFINSMTSHTMDGRVSAATPDGRKAARPFASSCNPYNVEDGGITGVLRSVSAIDFKSILGCAVNVRMHPSAIGESDVTRDKWSGLMRTYFKMGGAQLQPTVASVEMLRKAQENPEDHRDLIVKVGGYSTYFVDLGREIQDEVVARTEHGSVC